MSVKLLTKHHLEFLRLKGVCTGSFESTLVRMPHCWKSHVTAQMYPETAGGIFTVNCGVLVNGPRHEKTCLWGFRKSEFQTSILNYTDWLEN